MSVGGVGGQHPVAADLGVSVAGGVQATGAAQATLRTGSNGPEVKALQQELIALGIKVTGGADGIYGRATATAVAQFQKSAGLPSTGEADAATRAALAKKAGGASSGATVTGFKLTPDDGGFGPH